MIPFYQAAAELSGSFISRTRDDGSVFTLLGSGSPDWMSSAAMLAHDDEFPNDTRYELIRWASIALSDSKFTDKEEAINAVLDLSRDLVPSYTSRVLEWFTANTSRLSLCDDVAEELGEPLLVSDLLSLGYQRAAEQVLCTLIEEIEEYRLSAFNPDYDCRLLLCDSHGVYIPQLYCSDLTEVEASTIGVQWDDVLICQSGPDSEFYWEAWQSILDSAEITEPATLNTEESSWNLYQSGDLWLIRAGIILPEGF